MIFDRIYIWKCQWHLNASFAFYQDQDPIIPRLLQNRCRFNCTFLQYLANYIFNLMRKQMKWLTLWTLHSTIYSFYLHPLNCNLKVGTGGVTLKQLPSSLVLAGRRIASNHSNSRHVFSNPGRGLPCWCWLMLAAQLNGLQRREGAIILSSFMIIERLRI